MQVGNGDCRRGDNGERRPNLSRSGTTCPTGGWSRSFDAMPPATGAAKDPASSQERQANGATGRGKDANTTLNHRVPSWANKSAPGPMTDMGRPERRWRVRRPWTAMVAILTAAHHGFELTSGVGLVWQPELGLGPASALWGAEIPALGHRGCERGPALGPVVGRAVGDRARRGVRALPPLAVAPHQAGHTGPHRGGGPRTKGPSGLQRPLARLGRWPVRSRSFTKCVREPGGGRWWDWRRCHSCGVRPSTTSHG